MGAVLLTIALVLAAIVALAPVLLFVPADYSLSLRTGSGVRVGVRWLFGLVRIGGGGGERPPEARPKTRGDHAAKPSRRRRKSRRRSRPFATARTARQLLAIDGLIPRTGRLVRDVIRSLGWRSGRIAVRAGTGDPAETGEICGWVAPFLVCVPQGSALRVEFVPEFGDPVFRAEAEGGGRFVPARLVGAIGRFALSRPGRRAIRVLVWRRGR